AELLPDGPARDRAAPTARAIATALMRGPLDLEWWATAFSPSLEHVDRRKLALWSSRGADAFLGAIRTMVDLSERFENRVDDVVALRSDALLARITTLGTDRASGGAYEMPFLAVVVMGADGLVARVENFEVEREDEALARFDELTAEPAAARIAAVPRQAAEKRRVRANAATANAARLDAPVAARLPAALLTL